MTNKPKLTPDEQIEPWIKDDGETEIRLNCNPATIEKALDMAWKRLNDPLDDLRAEYEKVVGKKPHHKLSEAKMQEAIKGAK